MPRTRKVWINNFSSFLCFFRFSSSVFSFISLTFYCSRFRYKEWFPTAVVGGGWLRTYNREPVNIMFVCLLKDGSFSSVCLCRPTFVANWPLCSILLTISSTGILAAVFVALGAT